VSSSQQKNQPLIIATDEHDMRLDRWFREHFPQVTFGQLQKLLRSGQVRLDGKRCKGQDRVLAGQALRLPPFLSGDQQAPPASPALQGSPADRDFLQSITLFEDNDLMVLNKPAGLAVQGGSGTKRHVDGLLEALRDRQGRKPRLVHRLDKDTSGVLLIAKKKSIAGALAEQFRGRDVQKIYWALTYGVPKPSRGRISTFLAKEGPKEKERMVVARHTSDNQHALTYYQVIESSGHHLAWVALKPVSGRTHQLRVHCEHMVMPFWATRNIKMRPGARCPVACKINCICMPIVCVCVIPKVG
jgi:23S rRNA pseudouridine955/2504/2580 synthase